MFVLLFQLTGLLLAILCLALIGLLLFNPLFLMNFVARSNDVSRVKDIGYGKKSEVVFERHNLDIYVPSKLNGYDTKIVATRKPVIVFVYGGAWDTGHKDDYKFAAMEFAKLGYITAVPNYRLYPEAKFPHFIEDVALACTTLPCQLNALLPHVFQSAINGSPLDIILIGHSAGAHTVAMLNSQPEYLKQAESKVLNRVKAPTNDEAALINIKSCIGMAGPYDLPLDDPLVVGKFDGIELHSISEKHKDPGHVHNSHDANPINFAHKGMAPMLLMHGRADETVGLYHLERFAKRLKALGVSHETIIYDKVPHKHMVAGLAVLFHGFNDVFKDIKHYLEKIDDLRQ
jgi:acetyl esterase/lipase